jgi:hypothetical protein
MLSHVLLLIYFAQFAPVITCALTQYLAACRCPVSRAQRRHRKPRSRAELRWPSPVPPARRARPCHQDLHIVKPSVRRCSSSSARHRNVADRGDPSQPPSTSCMLSGVLICAAVSRLLGPPVVDVVAEPSPIYSNMTCCTVLSPFVALVPLSRFSSMITAAGRRGELDHEQRERGDPSRHRRH